MANIGLKYNGIVTTNLHKQSNLKFLIQHELLLGPDMGLNVYWDQSQPVYTACNNSIRK